MSFGGRLKSASVELTKPVGSEQILTRRHRPDYLIVLYMGLLMLLGLIIIYAIGPQRANVLNNAYGADYNDSYFFVKQVISLGLALVAFAAMAFVPYKWVLGHAGKILVIALIACAVLAVSGWLDLAIAQKSLGATRWFNLGVLGTFQPAELLKFGILVFLAGFLGMKWRAGKINDLNMTLIPLAVLTAVAMLFIIVIQKDMGTGIAIAGIILSMLFVAGINKRIMALIALALVVAGVVLIVSAPHRIERIITYLKGDNTSVDDAGGYHIEHAKIAIGSGGLFGVGIGNSVEATGYLPEAVNDSVFAIMGETFGFVGLVVIMVLFVALMMRLLKLMDHLVEMRLKLLAAGVFGWFGSHVILNIAAMIGIFPLTGITLPLLSSGGTSIIFITAALGLVFQLSRYTVHSSRLKEAQYEGSSSRRGVGRTRYAGGRGSSRT